MSVRPWFVEISYAVGVRTLFTLLLAAFGCQCGDDDAVRSYDGVVVAPTSPVPDGRTMIVAFSDPSTDVLALNAEELILGLTPARRPADEWNDPTAPGLEFALELALPPGHGVDGLHLDHAAPGVPDDDDIAYLDAVVAQIRSETDLPISYAIRARAITSAELMEAGFPTPSVGTDIADVVQRTAQIEWGQKWGQALSGRFDRVLIHVLAHDDPVRVADELGLLQNNLTGVELWVSVPPSIDGLAHFERADRIFVNRIPEGADIVEQRFEMRAIDMDRRMRRCCLRDSQIVTVYDSRYERDRYSNIWQEDACWLTGLYTSAMAFRFAVTGDEEARDQARAAYRAIHRMANITPMKGEVVRNYVRNLYAQTNPVAPGSDTIKRWRRAQDQEIYWNGDISVDQLSGWFYGMVVYHDLVADEGERAEIDGDIRAVLDMFLANDLRAIEHTGEPTTFGDLRGQPMLALAFFQIGYHVTGDEKYRTEFLRLMDEELMHFAYPNVLAVYHAAERFGSDHFYSSGLYPLLLLERDPEVKAKLDVGLQIFHELKRTHGDAYADTVYAVLHPSTDTARRAVLELRDFEPALIENAQFMRIVGMRHPGPFNPIELRAAGELDFAYTPPGSKGLRGGLGHRFPGVGYQIAYWMARYHGLIQVE